MRPEKEFIPIGKQGRQKERNPPQMTLFVVGTDGEDRPGSRQQLRSPHQSFRLEALHIEFDKCWVE
jgi:hypothetical protein